MNPRHSLFGLILYVLSASAVHAQSAGNATYSAGHPKPGKAATTILVKGVLAVDPNWNSNGVGQIMAWPKNGGAIVQAPLKLNLNGSWEGTIADLVSNSEYNVFVQFTLHKANEATTTSIVATRVVVTKAK